MHSLNMRCCYGIQGGHKAASDHKRLLCDRREHKDQQHRTYFGNMSQWNMDQSKDRGHRGRALSFRSCGASYRRKFLRQISGIRSSHNQRPLRVVHHILRGSHRNPSSSY